MTQEEKKNFIEKWFNKNKFNEASEILDTIDTSVKKVEHSKEISEEDLFGNIDSAIKLLQGLKDSGYTSIEQIWHGYEDNGFYAHKTGLETRKEYEQHLCKEINWLIYKREQEKRRKEELKKQIDAKQKELNNLRKML